MTLTYHKNSGAKRKVRLDGWRRQVLDVRDDNYRVKLPSGLLTSAPPLVDLRPICSEIEDQDDLGSCTANMFAGMVEANEISQGVKGRLSLAGANVSVSNLVTHKDGSLSYTTTVTPSATMATPLVQISRLFEYYATRKIAGTINEDSGATIRDTIKAGVKYGIVDEVVWPYDISKFKTKPPAAVWTKAAKHKVTSYHAITDGDITTMKAALAAGFLVGYGFQVYDYFLSSAMAKKGFLDLPKATEKSQGGHAQCLVGYDDNKVNPFRRSSKGAFLVRNSWGKDWALQGYYYVSYDYIRDTQLASDFWVIKSQAI